MIEPRNPIQHEVKCWPPFFAAMVAGDKPFDLRLNDRDYRVGDTLLLREWEPIRESYSGAECVRIITYVFPSNEIGKGCPTVGVLAPDWVVLGLRDVHDDFG